MVVNRKQIDKAGAWMGEKRKRIEKAGAEAAERYRVGWT